MPIPAVAGIALGSVSGLIQQISGLISSPALQQFGIILKDIAGVVGQALNPIFRVFNTIARSVGDALATVAPAFNSLFAVFEEKFAMLQPVFNQVLTLVVALVNSWVDFQLAIADVIDTVLQMLGLESGLDLLKDVIEAVGKVAIGAVQALKVLVENIKSLVLYGKVDSFETMWDKIVQRTNAAWNKAQDRRSSVGAGAFTASYTGLEEFEKKIREAAFTMGLGLTKDQEKESREKEQLAVLKQIEANTKAGGKMKSIEKVREEIRTGEADVSEPLSPEANAELDRILRLGEVEHERLKRGAQHFMDAMQRGIPQGAPEAVDGAEIAKQKWIRENTGKIPGMVE